MIDDVQSTHFWHIVRVVFKHLQTYQHSKLDFKAEEEKDLPSISLTRTRNYEFSLFREQFFYP